MSGLWRRRRFAACRRTPAGGDRRVQHVGLADVDAEDHLADDLVRGVEPLERLAGDRPVLWIFQRHVLGLIELAGGFRHLAEGHRAVRRLVGDHAVRSAALGRRHVPGIGAA